MTWGQEENTCAEASMVECPFQNSAVLTLSVDTVTSLLHQKEPLEVEAHQ